MFLASLMVAAALAWSSPTLLPETRSSQSEEVITASVSGIRGCGEVLQSLVGVPDLDHPVTPVTPGRLNTVKKTPQARGAWSGVDRMRI